MNDIETPKVLMVLGGRRPGKTADLLEIRRAQLERDAKVIIVAAEEKMIAQLEDAARALDQASLPSGKHMVVVPGGEILEIDVPPEIAKAEAAGRQSGDRNWMSLRPRYGRGRR